MFSNFLVPFDGSPSAYRAVNTAMEIGAGETIDVTVLQVQRMNDNDITTFDVAAKLANLATAENDAPQSKASTQSFIQDYFDSLGENVNISIVVERGAPADVICQYARDHDIDCIVMGRRGIGGIRAVLGSVSTAVLRDSDLPILVVK
jgi:nucleotide-binding universal stress UspA family protein